MRLAGAGVHRARAAGSRPTTHDAALRKVLGDARRRPAGPVAVYACDHDVAAHLGELSVTSLKARGVAGCVLDGGCRDVRFILDEGFPVFCRFVTPEDSTWRWELEATQVPVTIGRFGSSRATGSSATTTASSSSRRRSPRTCSPRPRQKAATESEIRAAVRDGMSPLEAYERYGTF